MNPFSIRRVIPTVLALLPAFLLQAAGSVVINEIMYHPPDDRDDLQYVEVLNAGPAPAELGGWALRKGARFTFPAGTRLGPGDLLVVAAKPEALTGHYGTNQMTVLGPFEGRLKHGGERLELVDGRGAVVDAVKYDDQAPWPVGPDGYGPSLERLLASAPGEEAASWSGSRFPGRKVAKGSPGRANDSAVTNLPPKVADFSLGGVEPGRPLTVTGRVVDADGVRSVTVLWQVASANPEPEREVELKRVEGDVRDGRWSGQIPAVPVGSLVRWRVRATDAAGSVRFLPGADEPRPTHTAAVLDLRNDAAVPFLQLWQFGAMDPRGASLRSRGRASGPVAGRGNACAVILPPGGGPPEVRDYLRLAPRQGGWKVRFHRDAPWEGMTTLNVLFEFQPRFVLSEHLSYELYRRAGVAAPKSGHARVWFNGKPQGYHLYVEQPNGSYLRRTGRDDAGNLYKLLWYGQGLVGQHEKKTNPRTGHADLQQIVRQLESARGPEAWKVIEASFNVTNFINYYAVSMCVQNWDGFFNNYFVYHDLRPGGKWEIIPWDQDKTWGDYDGAATDYSWYTLPLTFGMTGDPVAGGRRIGPFSFGGSGPWGGEAWWRPAGWFSGPLLANPEFRRRFLARLRQLCETEFTEAAFHPVIHDLAKRLEPEVRHRGELVASGAVRPVHFFGSGGMEGPVTGAGEAVEQFRRHIESFRRQVVERRKFLLRELDKAP